MGRPAFVSSVADFMNAAKNRRGGIGSGDMKEGAQGGGQAGAGGSGQQKGGLIDPKGAIVQSDDVIPYNAKEVSIVITDFYRHSVSYVKRASIQHLMKRRNPTSL